MDAFELTKKVEGMVSTVSTMISQMDDLLKAVREAAGREVASSAADLSCERCGGDAVICGKTAGGGSLMANFQVAQVTDLCGLSARLCSECKNDWEEHCPSLEAYSKATEIRAEDEAIRLVSNAASAGTPIEQLLENSVHKRIGKLLFENWKSGRLASNQLRKEAKAWLSQKVD